MDDRWSQSGCFFILMLHKTFLYAVGLSVTRRKVTHVPSFRCCCTLFQFALFLLHSLFSYLIQPPQGNTFMLAAIPGTAASADWTDLCVYLFLLEEFLRETKVVTQGSVASQLSSATKWHWSHQKLWRIRELSSTKRWHDDKCNGQTNVVRHSSSRTGVETLSLRQY